jgi:uncharacterized protein (UPF0332 family)
MVLLDDPLGYLKLAEKLSSLVMDTDLRNSKERTVIGRIYYGVFTYLKIKLYGTGTDKRVIHGKLRKDLQREADKKGLDFNLEDQLLELERLREHADYYRKIKIDGDSVKKAWVIYRLLEQEFNEIWPP